MRRMLLAVLTALALASSAQAASIQDLRSLGYTVKVVSTTLTCKEWAATGFGTSTKLGCEGTSGFQTAIDALADPETACDAKWQYTHHDQRSAVSQLDQLGYVVSADECAGRYVVTNRFTKASAYTGNGAGLVPLAAKLAAAAPSASALPVLASTCLPLCPSVTPLSLQAQTASKTKVALALSVSAADVRLALEKRDKASIQPLLSSALSSALGRRVRVTAQTACTIRGNPLDCSRLYNLIADTQVTVTYAGTTALEVGLPVPKGQQGSARPSATSNG